MKKIIGKFLELEKNDQIIFFLFLTTIGNVVMGFIKLFFSLYLPSIWFFVNAIFSITLAILRIFSIRDYRKMRYENSFLEKRKISLKNYLVNGILLIVLGITYFLVSIYMYYKDPAIDMHDYMTFLVAFIAFYSIGSAIYGMIKYRKSNEAILAAVKITNFSNALTSIVLTQVVLLQNFGDCGDVRIFNGFMGMISSILIMGLGLYMFISIKKYSEFDM